MKMTLVEDLKAIFEGQLPEGRMSIRTTHGAQDVELYGTNRRGFRIPLDQIDGFIEELEQTCTDSGAVYRLGKDGSFVEIPGFKVEKVAHYLREARDIGVRFAGYDKIF